MPQNLTLRVGDPAPDFSVTDVAGETYSLSSRPAGRSAVLVFLRYIGCPLCQMMMGELRRRFDDFQSRNADLLVFLETNADTLRSYGEARDFRFHIVPDPEKSVFSLYGVGSSNILAALHPDVLRKVVRATLRGYFHGKFDGDENQLPGDFIVAPDGSLIHAHLGRHVADNSSVDSLLAALDRAR